MIKKTLKCIISIVMVLSIMLSAVTAIFAASEIEEEYLSDMRLVYADSYNEAKLIVSESKLEGYEVLDHNLNSNSGEVGVWLVYKTTTDINDAITDVAIMQMGGGYKAGNYQQMIDASRDEYIELGEIYSEATTILQMLMPQVIFWQKRHTVSLICTRDLTVTRRIPWATCLHKKICRITIWQRSLFRETDIFWIIFALCLRWVCRTTRTASTILRR